MQQPLQLDAHGGSAATVERVAASAPAGAATVVAGGPGATAVFDLTPGSGQCARACMEMGIPYACTAKNAAHGSWLINVLDRMALAQICKQGSPLFQQDLSECLKEHFGETLDQLNEQDQAVETSILDENEA